MMRSTTRSGLWLLLICAVLAGRARATTYYLSPSGSDTNAGLAATSPWLTPNHAVRCGDTIVAAPSAAYQYGNFQEFGRVSCAANDDVAWLKCAQFDACRITVPSRGGDAGYNFRATGIRITNSYWGVTGWEVSNPTTAPDTQACIDVAGGVHHVVIANNVANHCGGAGIGASVDYAAVIGNIVYDSATSNKDCHSGIDVYAPTPLDHAPGTHIYVAGNFVWATKNPENPHGTQPCYDGNGIISDWIATHHCSETFTGGVLIENNLTLSNAGVGVRVEYSGAENYPNGGCGAWPGPSEFSLQIARHNTAWNNGLGCAAFGSRDGGELQIQSADNIRFIANLAVAQQKYRYCDKYPRRSDLTFDLMPAFQVAAGSKLDAVEGNWLYSAAGNPLQVTDRQGERVTNSTFRFGSNILGENPQLAAPFTPEAPACAGSPNAYACMAKVVDRFAPKVHAAASYGYQRPRATPVYDALFPQWLCHVHDMPAGLITMGCRAR